MTNLLRMFGRRLRRDKVFYLIIAIVALVSLFISLTNASSMIEWQKAGEDVALEDCYYNLAPLLGVAFAAYISLFLGVEHSDGTLRNRIVAGHSRISIMMSAFVISTVACLCIIVVFLGCSLPGLYWFKSFDFGWSGYWMAAAVIGCSALLYAAIFAVISIMTSNKAAAAVLALVTWFCMLFIGSIIVNSLAVPVGSAQDIGGVTRTVMEVFNHILPICPVIRASNSEFTGAGLDIIGSLGATAAVLIFGCLAFRKKDLK